MTVAIVEALPSARCPRPGARALRGIAHRLRERAAQVQREIGVTVVREAPGEAVLTSVNGVSRESSVQEPKLYATALAPGARSGYRAAVGYRAAAEIHGSARPPNVPLRAASDEKGRVGVGVSFARQEERKDRMFTLIRCHRNFPLRSCRSFPREPPRSAIPATGFMDPASGPCSRTCALPTAVTVHQPGVDGTIIGYRARPACPGDVLVVDRCGDTRHAGFGGVVAYAAKTAKVAGVIIDGVVADIGEIRQYGVPVWCRGLSAITTKRIGLGGSFCAPVACGGVAVRPGDVIIADECGVVVLDPADAEAAADRAIAMQDAEVKTRARLDAGKNCWNFRRAKMPRRRWRRKA